jgi:tetratricopeptide (TPR) repeat protein
MSRIMTGLFLALTCGLGMSAQAEVKFIDYDYTRFSQDVTECDRLASHGRDPGHVAAAVSNSGIDKPAAIAACQRAVAADPNNPRLNYLLGRAYGYSDRGEEAMPYRLKALEADYPQSLFVIGYLYSIGLTIEPDICKTYELWQRAARYRRLAALVALPRHSLRGDFDACGPAIPPEDLRAYLNGAKAQSSDYYVGMLVDDLLAEVDERYPTAAGAADG